MRDRILCRLVNTERHRLMPEDIVSVSYLDVSVVFCVFPENEKEQEKGVLQICGENLRQWGVERERMIFDAYENTRARYRYLIRRLSDVTEAIEKDAQRFLLDPLSVIEEAPEIGGGAEKARTGPYTLVNQELFNGAVVLLYPDVLAGFAEQIGADLILLPSSVNELVCLAWDDELEFGRLRGIVRSINRTCVRGEDILSNSLYRYVRERDRVELILPGGGSEFFCGRELSFLGDGNAGHFIKIERRE